MKLPSCIKKSSYFEKNWFYSHNSNFASSFGSQDSIRYKFSCTEVAGLGNAKSLNWPCVNYSWYPILSLTGCNNLETSHWESTKGLLTAEYYFYRAVSYTSSIYGFCNKIQRSTTQLLQDLLYHHWCTSRGSPNNLQTGMGQPLQGYIGWMEGRANEWISFQKRGVPAQPKKKCETFSDHDKRKSSWVGLHHALLRHLVLRLHRQQC